MKSYRVRDRLDENLLDDLLLARGIIDPASFLSPDFVRDSHDPFLLPDMGAAVERIEAALKNNEKVCVWSDYDCDGIPGGVILTQFLKMIGLDVVHYIPHRHEEGYGLNTGGIDELKNSGVSLIITIDLGTTEHESIDHAKGLGIDVIVTDHHLVQSLPNALVINPKREDSKYPFDGLCGAAVAWKLVQALLSKVRPEGFAEGHEKWFLDLIGIATLSDMVPLVGENRMLAHFGLRVMRSSGWKARRPGLSALLDLLRIKNFTLTEDDIGFMVAPRINAASRMDTPQLAAELLGAKNLVEGKELAIKLNKINDERKGLVAATVKEINKRKGEDGPVLVMGNPNWRPGILGLVANHLLNTQQKEAVFLWGREGGEVIRGSARSNGSVNLVDLMSLAGDMFDHFGGHAASGGFSPKVDKVHELPGRLAEAYEKVKKDSSKQEVMLDREMSLPEVPLAHRTLHKLAPFGVGNEKPIFLIPRVSITNMKTFGKNKDHLELSFSKDVDRINGVSFFSTPGSFTKKISDGERVDVVGNIESDWRGSPRLRIVDIL